MQQKITVCSMFRDSQNWCGTQTNQVDRFFEQMSAQSMEPSELCLLEGNSKDSTYKDIQGQITHSHLKSCLMKVDDGDGEVESTESPQRLKRLARIANKCLNFALLGICDKILWVESDLILPPNLIETLVRHMNDLNCQAIAPLIFLQGKNIFYDCWGYLDGDGEAVGNLNYPQILAKRPDMQIPAISVGSCVLMDKAFLLNKNIRFDDNCFRGLCRQIIDNEGAIFIDKSISVFHPSSKFINGRWV